MTNEAIKGLLKSLAESAGYKYATKEEAHNAQRCIQCGEPIDGRVRNNLERKEYWVTGLCGVCWDNMFNESDKEE